MRTVLQISAGSGWIQTVRSIRYRTRLSNCLLEAPGRMIFDLPQTATAFWSQSPEPTRFWNSRLETTVSPAALYRSHQRATPHLGFVSVTMRLSSSPRRLARFPRTDSLETTVWTL